MNGPIEIAGEQETEELVEADPFPAFPTGGRPVLLSPLQQCLLHGPLRILRGGGAVLALVLDQEEAELVGRHGGPTNGEPGKGGPDFRGGLHLRHLELAVEALEHLVIVASLRRHGRRINQSSKN